MFEKTAWIWHVDGETVNQFVDFAAAFTSGEGGATRLRISADSGYRAFLNGAALDGAQYPDYPAYKVYDEIDVTALVRPGQNRLCVVGYCQYEDSSVYRCGAPALWFEVEQGGRVVCRSGAETLCRRSLDYVSGTVDKFSDQLSYGFSYNAEQTDDWRMPNAPLLGFQPAKRVDGERRLVPRPVERLVVDGPAPAFVRARGVFRDEPGETQRIGDRMQRAFLSHRALGEARGSLPAEKPLVFTADGGDGMYILLDLGREEAGYFHLDIETDGPCEILAGFGEHLEDLRVRSSVGGRQFAVRYRARKGRQQFTHTFKRLGLRYLQLHVYAGSIRLFYAGVRPVRYPVRYKPAFRCADGLHNRIFDMSRRTLELCMHEHYEDCPWREQSLYAMDARFQMLCGYYLFEGKAFAQASLRLLALGQREDGLLELCAPARVPVVIPAFSLCFVTAVYENRLYDGGLDFVEEMLPVIGRILEGFLSRRDGSGLVPHDSREGIWNFYEWSPGLDGLGGGADYEAPLQFFLLMALEGAEELYRQTGRVEMADRYRYLRRELAADCAAFLDADTGLYATRLADGNPSHFAALTQALAVCAGACPDGTRPNLLKALAAGDGLIPLTLSSHWYKYEALLRRPGEYGRFVLDDIAEKWGRMVFEGATSFWETEKGAADFDDAGSLCHGWSAVPIYFYCKYYKEA